MAGSYLHVVDDEGRLETNEVVASMLENGGDVYEAVTEMYGMIWLLAHQVADLGYQDQPVTAQDIVENVRTRYAVGLRLSPGVKE